MTTITHSGFYTQALGEVSHPINIVREFLEAFGNKCKAAIVTWFDSWTRTKVSKGEEPWIYASQRYLAQQLGYNKDTINKHLVDLVDLGILDRDLYGKQLNGKRECSTLLKYKINFDNLTEYLAQSNILRSEQKTGHQEPGNQTPVSGFSDINLSSLLNSNTLSPNKELNSNNTADAVSFFEEEEIKEKNQEPELPINNSFGVDNETQSSSEQPINSYEETYSAVPRKDKAQIYQKQIIDTELKTKKTLMEGLGINWNPKLQATLANYSLEEVIKGIAAMFSTQHIDNKVIRNRAGYIINATKHKYLENWDYWDSLNTLRKKRCLWLAEAVARGIVCLFDHDCIASNYLYSTWGDFSFHLDQSIKFQEEYGWDKLDAEYEKMCIELREKEQKLLMREREQKLLDDDFDYDSITF